MDNSLDIGLPKRTASAKNTRIGRSLSPLQMKEMSWQRCIEIYNLDRNQFSNMPQIRKESLLKLQKDFGDTSFSLALQELNQLMELVGDIGYTATLANADGVIIAESECFLHEYYCESDTLGTVWTEQVGGTNAIGTALIEQCPASIYQEAHFFSQFASQSCVAAPFYDATGVLLGVLNLSIKNANLEYETHSLVYTLVKQSASRLEETLFKDRYHDSDIIKITDSTHAAPLLIAVDARDGRISGVSATARARLFAQHPHVEQRVFQELFQFASRDSSLGATHFRFRPIGSDDVLNGTVLHQSGTSSLLRRRAAFFGSPAAATPARARQPSDPVQHYAGQDRSLARTVNHLRKATQQKLPILLLGETGVGKDTLAKALHETSSRCKGPFVAFNCAAMPESLIDAELFGYSKGAFTGANREGSAGVFMEADGGTLFLDEIGDMPLSLQPRLLRVLETSEVTPLGTARSRKFNVQIIAATNLKLIEKVKSGAFRSDLFFRLAGTVADLPSLRHREDKEKLIEQFLASMACTQGVDIEHCPDAPETMDSPPRLTDAARDLLLAYEWPGNLRELKFVLQRALLHADPQWLIDAADIYLPFSKNDQCNLTRPGPAFEETHEATPTITGAERTPPSARQITEEAEKSAIVHALAQTSGNVQQAAARLGLSRATLYRKIKRYAVAN